MVHKNLQQTDKNVRTRAIRRGRFHQQMCVPWRPWLTLARVRVHGYCRVVGLSQARKATAIYQRSPALSLCKTRQRRIIKENAQVLSPFPGECIVIVSSHRVLALVGKARVHRRYLTVAPRA
jgi:hypothetical protein